MITDHELDDLRQKMEESISRVPVKEIVVPVSRVRDFCEIIGELHPVYFDPDQARGSGEDKVPLPESYFLTMIAPLSHDLFTTGIGHLLGALIKGIIHTSSVIELYEPLYCDTPYHLKLELSRLVRKRGKMGEYLVGTFLHKVFSAGAKLVAMDSHVFFLRTS
jgi:hypothetical protein